MSLTAVDPGLDSRDKTSKLLRLLRKIDTVLYHIKLHVSSQLPTSHSRGKSSQTVSQHFMPHQDTEGIRICTRVICVMLLLVLHTFSCQAVKSPSTREPSKISIHSSNGSSASQSVGINQLLFSHNVPTDPGLSPRRALVHTIPVEI